MEITIGASEGEVLRDRRSAVLARSDVIDGKGATGVSRWKQTILAAIPCSLSDRQRELPIHFALAFRAALQGLPSLRLE